MKAWLLIALLRLLSLLRLGAARALGGCVGSICWKLPSRMKRTTRKNLELCLPELSPAEREQLAKKSLRETFVAIAESGAVWLWPAEKIIGKIHRVRGKDLLLKAHGEGKGVIVIGPHLGNWELTGLYLNICGLGRTIQLFQAPRDVTLAAFAYTARSRAGAAMVPTGAKGVVRLLRALRSRQVVGILPDQVPPESSGAFAPFFGRPALTMTLISRLIHKTGARALIAFSRRINGISGAGFELVFQEVDPRLYSPDLATSLAGLNASVETAVRQIPAQYQWEYKRFKRQPPGVPRPY